MGLKYFLSPKTAESNFFFNANLNAGLNLMLSIKHQPWRFLRRKDGFEPNKNIFSGKFQKHVSDASGAMPVGKDVHSETSLPRW